MKHNNKKTKKGFTLVELLAVIVVLAIILIIAGYSILKNLNDSKAKAKFLAAKDIVTIAGAYIEEYESEITTLNEEAIPGAKVEDMIRNEFLEQNVTNPKTGKNQNIISIDKNGVESYPHEIHEEQIVIKYNSKAQTDYKVYQCQFGTGTYDCYLFNGYQYILGSHQE